MRCIVRQRPPADNHLEQAGIRIGFGMVIWGDGGAMRRSCGDARGEDGPGNFRGTLANAHQARRNDGSLEATRARQRGTPHFNVERDVGIIFAPAQGFVRPKVVEDDEGDGGGEQLAHG